MEQLAVELEEQTEQPLSVLDVVRELEHLNGKQHDRGRGLDHDLCVMRTLWMQDPRALRDDLVGQPAVDEEGFDVFGAGHACPSASESGLEDGPRLDRLGHRPEGGKLAVRKQEANVVSRSERPLAAAVAVARSQIYCREPTVVPSICRSGRTPSPVPWDFLLLTGRGIPHAHHVRSGTSANAAPSRRD